MKTKQIQKEAPKYIKKWVDIALHQPTRDEATVVTNIHWLYEQCGLDPVPVQIVNSLDDWIKINKQVQLQVERNVGLQIKKKIECGIVTQIHPKIESQVDPDFCSQVMMEVWSPVWHQVWGNVTSYTWYPMRDRVMAYVNYKLRQQISSKSERKKIREQIRKQVWSQFSTQIGQLAADIAYSDFLYTNGLIKENKETFYKYADAVQDGCMAIFLKDKCYILAKPTYNINEKGKLHNARGRAVDWGQGSFYFFDKKSSFSSKLQDNSSKIICKKHTKLYGFHQKLTSTSKHKR